MRFVLFPMLLLVHFCVQGQNDCYATINATENGCDVSFSGYAGTGGSVISWDWNFGDGGFSNQQSPSHTYAQNGTYSVDLTIMTSDSCTATTSYTVTVSNCQQCFADFNWSDNGCDVSFSDNSSAFATVTSWNWYFGDGSSSSDPNPTHTYAQNGTYIVSLDINTSDGCMSSYSDSITVSNCGANCASDFSYSILPNCKVQFHENAYTSNSNLSTYFWDFGDGNTSIDQDPVHTYTGDGTYTVILSITTTDGCYDYKTENIYVNTCSTECHAYFSYDNYQGCTVNFTEYATTTSGNIVSWSWDFGDGGSSTDQNPNHTYAADSTYEVNLTITTDDGCTHTEKQFVSVTGCSPQCAAYFSYDNYQGCTVSFTEYSHSDNNNISSWSWDFGDGNSSTDPNPSHTYAGDSTYDVTLTITTADGCTSSETQPVSVTGCSTQCAAYFSYDNYQGCTVSFTDYSHSDNNNISSWSWDFGDGNSSTDPNPSHTYAGDSTYDVTLTITTADGCTSSETQPVSVTGCSTQCAAYFSYDNYQGCTVSFTDYSHSDNNNINSWSWDFGDGGTSSVSNPTYTYGADGQYDVTLSIQTADGCVSSETQTVQVSNCSSGGQCVSNFSYTSTQQPCTFAFFDMSNGAPSGISKWDWDFGDGQTSTSQNPIHAYGQNGVYVVSLKIETYDGCTDIKADTLHVQGCNVGGCLADFSYQGDSCNIQFQDQSNPSPGATIMQRFWDFGDGSFGLGVAPAHQYVAAGTYDVSLYIHDSNGCQDTIIKSLTVNHCSGNPPSPCVADFNFQGDSCVIGFQDVSTPGTGQTIAHWHWDFGDGAFANTPNPVHQYPAAGTYAVTLNILDSNGCLDSLKKTVVANHCSPPGPCFADFNWQGDSCKFFFQDLSGPGSGGLITNWSWDFGDGTHANVPFPMHQYAAAGTYSVKLKIMDNSGCVDSVMKTVVANHCSPPGPCFADFNWQGDSCLFHFQDLSGPGSGSLITNWSWDFGDGTHANVPHPIHQYAAAGTYSVKLKIMDNSGCYDSVMKTVVAHHCPPPGPCFANFNFQGDSCKFFFQDLSGPSSGSLITNWSWDFGDGTHANIPFPMHQYAAAGTYSVKLKIMDNSGCYDSVMKTVVAHHCPPPPNCYADFSYFEDTACTVDFTDMSSTSDPITNWSWDFGDGHIGGGSNPTHIFPQSGSYQVTLVISTAGGCTDTNTQTVIVTSCGNYCHADFSYFEDTACTVDFTDMSTTSDPITNWSWDFGDGHIGGGANPTHIFPQSGSYQVTLVITTTGGCTDTNTQTVIVTSCGNYCHADFSYFEDTACTVDFADMSTTSDPITNWSWDFGDGHIGGGPNPTHTFPQSGSYQVTLVISTAGGCTDTNTQTVIVNSCGNLCHADFSYSKNACEVAFTDFSSSSDPVISWKWKFGDGTISTEQNPLHSYDENGKFRVSLVITTAGHCKDTVNQMISITGCEKTCQADFEYVISKRLVYFENTSQGEIESWEWNFGDGNSSNLEHPIHNFQQDGTYKVFLKIRSIKGCTSWIQKIVSINSCDKDCKADFSYGLSSNCQVEFSDYSFASDQITSWIWDFGDGNISNQQSAFHTYQQDGEYPVSLEITTASGCKNKVRHLIRIKDCEGGTNRPVEKKSIIQTNLGKQLLSDPVQLYPNPSKGVFQLEASFTKSILVEWEVVDIRGRRLLHSNIQGSVNGLRQQLDLSKMSEGVYFFQLRTEEGLLYRQKMMKQ